MVFTFFVALLFKKSKSTFWNGLFENPVSNSLPAKRADFYSKNEYRKPPAIL
jgi:hypothetical protein